MAWFAEMFGGEELNDNDEDLSDSTETLPPELLELNIRNNSGLNVDVAPHVYAYISVEHKVGYPTCYQFCFLVCAYAAIF